MGDSGLHPMFVLDGKEVHLAKVFVVGLFRSEASMDWRIIGVFSSKTLAEACRASLNDEGAHIEEWEIDRAVSVS